jgi:signal transduction histidine kinase
MSELLIVPAHRELNERVRWLIQLRWLAVLGIVIVISIANALLPNVLPLVPLASVTLAIALYNAVIYFCAKRMDSSTPESRYRQSVALAHSQITLDIVALTLLLHFAGGLESPFFFYYVLHVIAASILLSKRASLMYAALATCLFCGMLILEATGTIPHYNLKGYRVPSRYAEPIHITSVGLALASTLFFTTYVASSIIARLRVQNEELVQSNLACELRTEELLEANLACELRSQELAALNARLRELDAARMQFTLLVTHELRAPVAAIQSYLKLILDGYVPQERQREILERSERRAREQLDLIADLLELGKMQQTRAAEQTEPVQVEEVLKSVYEMMRTYAQEKGVSLSTEIAADLPAVIATPNQIRQLWVNLISNAIKYTEPGGTVVASLSQTSDHLVGAVQDTGIGIAPKDHERIFQDFFRTDEAKAMERQGTGLGLSIVKRILEIYGGEIQFESEVGKGSTFTFTLPK